VAPPARFNRYYKTNCGVSMVTTRATDEENILLHRSINFEAVNCALDAIMTTKVNRKNTNGDKDWSPFIAVVWPRPESLNDVRAFAL